MDRVWDKAVKVLAAVGGAVAAVAKSLILGAYQASDGTKGRYFDGTISQFIIGCGGIKVPPFFFYIYSV